VLAFFIDQYPDQVSVYSIGDHHHFISREFCGGPHVKNTSQIKQIKIFKEQSAGAGVRRIYARFTSH
jgi:alanyl-tRNA synthetase